MPKKKSTVKLSDLLNKGESNADLHKDDPERRKWHKRYRTPRDRLMHVKGSEHTRPLASDPALDAKYNQMVREFVSNGFNATKAYAAVHGCKLSTARSSASILFRTSFMRAKVQEYLNGVDGEFAEPPKEYVLQKLIYLIEANVLDYYTDDGHGLSVKELKRLPQEAMWVIKSINSTRETVAVAVEDQDGNVVLDDNGVPHYVLVEKERVRLELFDKLKAIESLGKIQKWIGGDTNIDLNLNLIDSRTMERAESRIKQLRREDIEGTFERITDD